MSACKMNRFHNQTNSIIITCYLASSMSLSHKKINDNY